MNNLTVIEHQSQRVLLTSQLATGYETDVKNIQMNFSNHKQRFEEGKHYHRLTGEVLKRFLQVNDVGLQNQSKIRTLYLWTERGALRHAKILDTDKAWEVYEELEDIYFRVKQLKLSKELQAIFQLDHKQQQFETRLDNLENNTTIDFGQQRNLQVLAQKTVLRIIGGKETPVYRDKPIRSKVFSSLWRDYKDYMQVASYRDTLKIDYNRAVTYITNWRLNGKLLREIEECNSQMELVI